MFVTSSFLSWLISWWFAEYTSYNININRPLKSIGFDPVVFKGVAQLYDMLTEITVCIRKPGFVLLSLTPPCSSI